MKKTDRFLFLALAISALAQNPAWCLEFPLHNKIEQALKSVDPSSWTFRYTNLYRLAAYKEKSAVCDFFPGAMKTRFACSIQVTATLDDCASNKVLQDNLIFRVILSANGKIISAAHDGGDDSTARACDQIIY